MKVGRDNVIAVKVSNAAVNPTCRRYGGLHLLRRPLSRRAAVAGFGAPRRDRLRFVGRAASPDGVTASAAVASARRVTKRPPPAHDGRRRRCDPRRGRTVGKAHGRRAAIAPTQPPTTRGDRAGDRVPAPVERPAPIPYLYTAQVEVRDGRPRGRRRHRSRSAFAPLRRRRRGLLAQRASAHLHGVNRHQDRLDQGWAIGKAEHDEDMALIGEIGATAVRLAHYQHAEYFYDLCDRRAWSCGRRSRWSTDHRHGPRSPTTRASSSAS